MGQNIFITGGTGFLGQRTVRHLVARGHTVAALTRSERSAAIAQELGARPVAGRLSDVPAFETELRGIDTVIHAAAPVKFWGRWPFFEENIVQATRQLAEAAARQDGRNMLSHVEAAQAPAAFAL